MNGKSMAFIGAVGAMFTTALGGWDNILQLLVIAMVVDYLTGLMVAGIWKASPKSENGALESRAGFKGLCRKGVILSLVLVAHYMDLAMGIQYVRDAMIIGFSANELLSIVENIGLMGIEYPQVLKTAIDALKKKGSDDVQHS